MAIYAQIVDGLIVNRAVFADKLPEDWPDRETWAPAEDGMEIGAVLTKDGWVAPKAPEQPAELEPRRRVARIDIVRRLAAVGLLAAAEKAIAGADALTRQEWATADLGVYADDPKTIGFLRAIGANPDTILAP